MGKRERKRERERKPSPLLAWYTITFNPFWWRADNYAVDTERQFTLAIRDILEHPPRRRVILMWFPYRAALVRRSWRTGRVVLKVVDLA